MGHADWLIKYHMVAYRMFVCGIHVRYTDFILLVLILYVPVNNCQSCRGVFLTSLAAAILSRGPVINTYHRFPCLFYYIKGTISVMIFFIFKTFTASLYDVGLVVGKPDFVTCEQQRHRQACASAQSDQRLCYSRSGK